MTRALLGMSLLARTDREMAAEICSACVAGLDVDGAAISLYTSGPLRETLFASDATADLLEELQFTFGEGACMDAARTGHPVLVPDMGEAAATSRWPAYAAAVVEQAGAGAVFAFPLQWAAVNLGVLDLYRRSPGSLPSAQLRDSRAAADVAALMLLGLRTDPGTGPAWDHAWGNRAEIHQATGMVMAQAQVTATDAFARLRAHSFATQRLVGDVAHDVVNRTLRFTEDHPEAGT